MDRLESDDLGQRKVHLPEQLAQVFRIVVAEYVARSATVADALDHGRVVASIRKDMTSLFMNN